MASWACRKTAGLGLDHKRGKKLHISMLRVKQLHPMRVYCDVILGGRVDEHVCVLNSPECVVYGETPRT